mgnify:CR=1 FL=1
MDWTPYEDEMILRAGKCAGEILDEHDLTICHKSNLNRTITKDQWLSFLRSLIGEYFLIKPEYEKKYKEMYELNDEIPF